MDLHSATTVRVDTAPAADDDRSTGARASRWGAALRCPFSAAIGALLFGWASLTPSLLPRNAVFQGLVTGLCAAVGYTVGLGIGWLVRQFVTRSPSGRVWHVLWRVTAVAAVMGTAAFGLMAFFWQNRVRDLMGMERLDLRWVLVVLPVAVAFAALLVAAGRMLRLAARSLARLLGRVIPARTAAAVAIILVGLLTVGLLDGLVVNRALVALDSSFAELNRETEADVSEPTARELSGSPDSRVDWDSLGNEGRTFVAGATPVGDLDAFSGGGAIQPIRAYAGINSADDVEDRAALAVRELERTGAFGREVLVVAMTTGTGWVDEHAVDPLEYMYNGDTAIVAMQYSYLPSWLSFLIDRERAEDAAVELFEAVYAVWSRRPDVDRPRLMVYGESLGAFGAEAPFSGDADMRNRTAGMLLVGPPNGSELWSRFVAERDAGSPIWRPVYEDGQVIRFANHPEDFGSPAGLWREPRIGYLQHASDPVVWWSPRLLLERPAWLEPGQPRGDDVLPEMRWYPIVTFLQVTIDLTNAYGVPFGHGHRYGADKADAWASIIPPAGWTPEQTEELHEIVAGG